MKLAVIVQRYGAELNGGAELHARYVAEHLAQHAEVEVLTTCATDYITWRNELDPGPDVVNDVPVRRFPVSRERDVDDFGHQYFDGAGHYLSDLAEKHFKTRTRYEKPGTIQRSMAACVSRTDAHEAEMVGRAAVRYALQGTSDRMVTLLRDDSRGYACSTGLAPLAEVAGKVWKLPEEYFDRANYMATQAFLDYARPLIGPALPDFGRLHT